MENLQPDYEQFQPDYEQLYFINNQDDEHDDIESILIPGYRFVPYDVELIDDYLRKIVSTPGLYKVHKIYTVNLYGSGPDELTAAHKEHCEGIWYFFTQRNRKYANGNRPDRSAGNGYWKQTNVINHIFRQVDGKDVKIGRKITLDYYIRSDSTGQGSTGTHTDWKMNEYRLDDEKRPQNSTGATAEFSEWCLCRLYKSKSGKPRNSDTQVTLQVAGAPRSNTQLIASQERSEPVAGQRDTNFTGQSTEASFSDQHIIAQQQYNGHNAGGPGLNFVQQSTNLQSSSDCIWTPINSNYMANATSGSMNGMHNNNAELLFNHQASYPLSGTMHDNAGYVQPTRNFNPISGTMHENAGYVQPTRSINLTSGTMHENAGYVQPTRSLASGGVPMGSHSNINQSSLSIPDVEFDDFPRLSFPDDFGSSSDLEFDDFDDV